MKMNASRVWNASWIWPRDRTEPNLHLLFCKDFEAEGNEQSAVMHIAAESAAQVFLNGHEVGRTSANSYPGQHYYEEFDCLSALRSGQNELAILARYIGIPSSASIPKDPGLLCEITLAGQQEEKSVGSDASWKCQVMDAWLGRQRRSEWLNLDQVEILDLRRLPEGFPFPKDLSQFEEPEAARWPGVRFAGLEPRSFPKTVSAGDAHLTLIRAGSVIDRSADHPIPALAMSEETIEAQDFTWDGASGFSIPPQAPGHAFSILVGFDNYWSGRPELVLSGPEGAIVDIAWHEKLADGRFDVRDTRVYTADRFICAQGENRIVPEEWKTGRFLQLTFRQVSAPIQVKSLQFHREEYPLHQRLAFQSSDDRLNRIFEISLHAVRRCMHDNIMDCPWRERRQWIGDVQRISLINHFAFGDTTLVRAVLRQHAHLQDSTGRMWVCVPIWEEFPTQSMEWLRAVLEYTEYTGDQTLLQEIFDNAEMLHRWFLRHREGEGVLFLHTPPLQVWIDNPHQNRLGQWQYQVPFLGYNLRYLLFLDDMADCFQRMGRPEDHARVVRDRKKLGPEILKLFRDSETGLLSDCPPGHQGPPKTFSEMGHALAICADLLSSEEAKNLWDQFQKIRLERPDAIIHPSPFGKYHTHQALARMGRHDAIMDDILTLWGPMVDAGAATTWESFEGKTSHCHGWAGIPILALAGLILGFDPRKAGTARKEGCGSVAWMEVTRE